MTSRPRTSPVWTLALLALGACSPDSRGGGSPLGPEAVVPDVPSQQADVDLLRRLLLDSYSVEGLSRFLHDDVAAERIRRQVRRLTWALDDGDLVLFAGLLEGLAQLGDRYLDGPGYDQRDLPVISALELYVAASWVVLDWDEDQILAIVPVLA